MVSKIKPEPPKNKEQVLKLQQIDFDSFTRWKQNNFEFNGQGEEYGDLQYIDST